MEFITCGDINTNYLHCHNRRQQLESLLAMYILKSTVNFPTRIINCSITAIDNIFIDLSRNFTLNHPHQWVVTPRRSTTNIRKCHYTYTRTHILLFYKH